MDTRTASYNDRTISVLETSLFEAGSQLWKSFIWLLVICATLFLVSFGISAGTEMRIPLIDLNLSKPDAVAAMLVMYSLVYLRYVVTTNYQKYLFWDLAEKGGYYAEKTYPWQALHPNAVNAIGYYAYVKGGALEADTLRFIVIINWVFIAIPPVSIGYLCFTAFGQSFPTTCLFVSAAIFAYAVAHMRKHYKRDVSQRERVQGFFDRE